MINSDQSYNQEWWLMMINDDKWGFPKWIVYKGKSIYKWVVTGGTPPF